MVVLIWRRKDPDQDHFVAFDHQSVRIAALEADLADLTKDLLSYIDADLAAPWKLSGERLRDTLRDIIKRRDEASQ
jgi:hypothetical protein